MGIPEGIHHVRGVSRVNDGELRRKRERLGVRPDNAVRHRVESAAEDSLGRATVGGLCPGEHVVSGPPGKGEQQDPARLDALIPQPGCARHQRAGFAGAGPGQDQQRAALVRRRSPLIVVEDIKNTGQPCHGH